MVVDFDAVYAHSQKTVEKNIPNGLLIIPLCGATFDLEKDSFKFNAVARVVWDKLDGKRTLRQVARGLVSEFNTSAGTLERDLSEFVADLLKRGLLIKSLVSGAEGDLTNA